MKFGKELKKQKVPEWIEAYMDYNGLKSILSKIRQTKQNEPHPKLNRTLSGLNCHSRSHHSSNGDTEDQEIGITAPRPRRDGSRRFFEPNFLKLTEEESAFFEKLDEELDKVSEFYKGKVEEMVDEANGLSKQMEALVALRVKVGNRGSDGSGSREQRRDSLRVLEHVKMNSTVQTPISTVRGAFGDSRDGELRRVEEQLRVAFVEFYHKLHLLKHYRLFILTNCPLSVSVLSPCRCG